VNAYGRLSAAELSDLALQLEEIRLKLARGGLGTSTDTRLSAQISVVEEVAASRALYELRERQKADTAKAASDAVTARAKAREDAQGGQAVQEQRGIYTPPPGAIGTVTFNGAAPLDDEMAF
jgi:hypothetical protein